MKPGLLDRARKSVHKVVIGNRLRASKVRCDVDETRKLLVAARKETPLFAGFSVAEVEALAGHVRAYKVARGTQYVRRGERAAFAAVLLRGAASASADLEGRATLLYTLDAGETIGEAALFHDCTRPATVTCTADCLIAEVSGSEVEELTREAPGVAAKVVQAMFAAAARQLRLQGKPQVAIHSEPSSSAHVLVAQMSNQGLVDGLRPKEVEALCAHLELASFGKGQRVAHRGAPSRHVLLLLRGQVELKGDAGKFNVTVSGRVLSEGFITDAPHEYDIVTLQDCTFAVLKTETLGKFVAAHPAAAAKVLRNLGHETMAAAAKLAKAQGGGQPGAEPAPSDRPAPPPQPAGAGGSKDNKSKPASTEDDVEALRAEAGKLKQKLQTEKVLTAGLEAKVAELEKQLGSGKGKASPATAKGKGKGKSGDESGTQLVGSSSAAVLEKVQMVNALLAEIANDAGVRTGISTTQRNTSMLDASNTFDPMEQSLKKVRDKVKQFKADRAKHGKAAKEAAGSEEARAALAARVAELEQLLLEREAAAAQAQRRAKLLADQMKSLEASLEQALLKEQEEAAQAKEDLAAALNRISELEAKLGLSDADRDGLQKMMRSREEARRLEQALKDRMEMKQQRVSGLVSGFGSKMKSKLAGKRDERVAGLEGEVKELKLTVAEWAWKYLAAQQSSERQLQGLRADLLELYLGERARGREEREELQRRTEELQDTRVQLEIVERALQEEVHELAAELEKAQGEAGHLQAKLEAAEEALAREGDLRRSAEATVVQRDHLIEDKDKALEQLRQEVSELRRREKEAQAAAAEAAGSCGQMMKLGSWLALRVIDMERNFGPLLSPWSQAEQKLLRHYYSAARKTFLMDALVKTFLIDARADGQAPSYLQSLEDLMRAHDAEGARAMGLFDDQQAYSTAHHAQARTAAAVNGLSGNQQLPQPAASTALARPTSPPRQGSPPDPKGAGRVTRHSDAWSTPPPRSTSPRSPPVKPPPRSPPPRATSPRSRRNLAFLRSQPMATTASGRQFAPNLMVIKSQQIGRPSTTPAPTSIAGSLSAPSLGTPPVTRPSTVTGAYSTLYGSLDSSSSVNRLPTVVRSPQ